MKESQIERRLVEGVKRLGGMCLKFVSPGTLGVPDRIIIIQRYVIGEMQKRGADARVVKGIDEVKELLAEIEGGDEA